jgi:hypothetical protein
VSKEATEALLEHHGVKGMHWGIRNPESRVTIARREKHAPSSDFKRTAPHRGKPVHTLTNKQLKDVNERLNLEQNYSRMNPDKVKSGKKVVTGILGNTGKTVASTLLTGAALYGLKLAIQKKAGSNFAKAITGK